MPCIDWESSFSVNNDEIDKQHKTWIGIFNNLHNALTGDGEEDLEVVAKESLQAMLDYTKYHFKYEEGYMRKIGYPDRVKHMRMHKDFDVLVYQCNRDSLVSKPVLNTKIIKMIRTWILDHILVEDKKYVPYIAEYESSK